MTDDFTKRVQRAYVEAGLLPLKDYVAKYGDTPEARHSMTMQDMPRVTQADREIAAALVYNRAYRESILSGKADGSAYVQMFARHREAAEAAAKAREAELVKALREIGRKAWRNRDILTCREIEEITRPLLLTRHKAGTEGGV